jgi:nickel-dependent lactate racemase
VVAPLIKPKTDSTLHKKYLVPAQRLAVYEFPEELAFWALHMAGVKAHSNTRHPTKQTGIVILDPNARLFGDISFESAKSQNMVWVIVNDMTRTAFFAKAIETYLTEVLGVVIPPASA